MAQKGWDLNACSPRGKPSNTIAQPPSLIIPPEDAQLLRQWSSPTLHGLLEEEAMYFQGGRHGTKRDLLHDLDPLEQGLLTDVRAEQLVSA